MYLTIQFALRPPQRSIAVMTFATESGGPYSNLPVPTKIVSLFYFFSSLFFIYLCFNVLGVLSVPASQNADILCRFSTINYQTLTDMGSNDRCNFPDKFMSLLF